MPASGPVDTAAIVRSVVATFSEPIAEAHAEVTVGELPTVQGRPRSSSRSSRT